MGSVIDILIILGVIVIVAVVVWFLLAKLQLPEPAGTIVQVVVVIVVAVLAIGFLLSFLGGGGRLSLGKRADSTPTVFAAVPTMHLTR